MRSVDPKLAVYTFMGAINWMPRWFTPEGRLSGAEVSGQMTDLLLTGLVTPAASSGVAPNTGLRSKGRAKAPG